MSARFRPRLETIEDRLAPAAVGPFPGEPVVLVPAGGDRVRVYDPGSATDTAEFAPFPGFTGDLRWMTGDVTGDRTSDLIVAPGPGGEPRVRVFDGVTLEPVADFLAFEPDFRGGLYVAAGDVNRDGAADVVVGAGEGGGPRVRAFDGRTLAPVADFLAFEGSFRGGVRVAAGDVDLDGAAEVVVGAGPGGAPRVTVFRPDGAVVTSFYAYDEGLRGGVTVAAVGQNLARTGPDGFDSGAKVATAPGAGGAPHVRVFVGTTGAELQSFFLGDTAGRGGVELLGGGTYNLVTRTPDGPTLGLVSWQTGPASLLFPPGTTYASGTVAAVDPAGGTLTLQPFGNDARTYALRTGAVVELDDVPARLDDLRPGDVVHADLAAADGRATRLRAVSASRVITVPAPPPVPVFVPTVIGDPAVPV